MAALDLETNIIMKIIQAHLNTANILQETARQEGQKMEEAAAIVKWVSTVDVFMLKTNLEQSSNSKATPRPSNWKSRTTGQGHQS
jgi:hypothetical protein